MLKIIQLTKEIIDDYKEKGNIQFIENKSIESIIARYEIYKENNILVDTNNYWIPIYENDFFWSISHKKNLVFIATFDENIWIDIEILNEERSRDVFSLHKLDEYLFFWWVNFINFYKLWTIKESVIKLNLSGIDNLNDVKIDKIIKKKNIVDTIFFDYEIFWTFLDKNFYSINWINWNMVYSVSYFIK